MLVTTFPTIRHNNNNNNDALPNANAPTLLSLCQKYIVFTVFMSLVYPLPFKDHLARLMLCLCVCVCTYCPEL